MAMEDWIPTIMSELGQPNLKEQLLEGADIGGTNYRVHLDGYDQTPVITRTGPSNRKEFFFFTETTFHGLRFLEWKFLFTKQDKWFNGVQDQLTTPLITRLDLDPFERFHEGRGFDEWQENRSWSIQPALSVVNKFVESFEDYPARLKSFDADTSGMVEKMMSPTSR